MLLQLMAQLFEVIEHGKVGVFESPTGTGKTLSLLCSAFTWLALNRQRAVVGTLRGNAEQADEEPNWVVAHDEEKQREMLEASENEIRAKLRKVREHQSNLRLDPAHRSESENARKKRRVDEEYDSDTAYLIDEYDETSRTIRRTKDNGDAYAFLSAEARAMMEEYESSFAPREDATEPSTTPKIYYASRTHSQLSQLVHELKKTEFGTASEAHDPVRSVSLGSRKQMCINPSVRDLGATYGTEAMNERCMDLMESGKSKLRCSYLPPMDHAGQQKMDAFRDRALAEVHDIEELVRVGKDMHVCPYFGARNSVRQAELVTLPYNMLLQRDARDALQLSLDDSVVIIDEAHNLIDTILATYSAELSQTHIQQATEQVRAYLHRFSLRLKGTNEEHLRTLQVLLSALQAYCTAKIQAFGDTAEIVTETLTTVQFTAALGGTVDLINLVRLEHWLKDTRIARKISGYADKQWVQEHGKDCPRRNKMQAMHLFEGFLLALSNRAVNGKVMVTVSPASTEQDRHVHFKYLLLNPAEAFQPLLDAARSVILAGGTMEPMSEFQTQLFDGVSRDQFQAFSCAHIVPQENILGAIVNTGPKGTRLEFTYDAWKKPALLDDLANALSNYCNIIPHGIIVFLPSYASLNMTMARWKITGALDRIAKRKRVRCIFAHTQIFMEPKHTQEVDGVLHSYAAAITAPSQNGSRGAILFAVVGAKLSEGINFQDDLARCVVMVGLPFPNSKSKELSERMEYLRKTEPSASGTVDKGRELYLNLCMRAVNQSMGTCFDTVSSLQVAPFDTEMIMCVFVCVSDIRPCFCF
ncbi:RNA helicase [Malassezia vespertilionis]|uniref:RNA helicase n=1 Tax=Malassezia vespertilionis TaxID=2020962 RepID=UPI0024B0DA66|nr:RNA helicase [Malassezia vespertilionis]WFD05647.1 RNA helicase [Malassezia vespertilionis]